MKQFFIVFVVIFVNSCGVNKKITSVDDIFVVVKNTADKTKCGVYPKLFYENKKSLYTKLDFINIKQDTIYILQEYDIESGQLKESIWNDDSKLEYTSFKNEVKESTNALFDDNIYETIATWNENKLMRQSNDFGANDITAYRVSINDGIANVDCLVFQN